MSTEIAEDNSITGKPAIAPPGNKQFSPTPSSSPKEAGTLRASLSKMIKGVLGSFSAVAFNGAQILVVLITVFFGVIFMLMNPRPIFGAILSLFPQRNHNQAVIILQRIGKFVPIWAGATLLGMLSIGLLVFHAHLHSGLRRAGCSCGGASGCRCDHLA